MRRAEGSIYRNHWTVTEELKTFFFFLILVAYVCTAGKWTFWKLVLFGHRLILASVFIMCFILFGVFLEASSSWCWKFSNSFSRNHIRLLQLAGAKVGWDDCPTSVSRAKQKNVFCRKKLLQRSPVVLFRDLQVLSLEIICSDTQTCFLLCLQRRKLVSQ